MRNHITSALIRTLASSRLLRGSSKDQKVQNSDVTTLKRYDVCMEESKRATIYFDADVHRALRLRAAACDRSISDMVNEAVRMTLAEDADDLRDVEQREEEESIGFEEFVGNLRKSGRI